MNSSKLTARRCRFQVRLKRFFRERRTRFQKLLESKIQVIRQNPRARWGLPIFILGICFMPFASKLDRMYPNADQRALGWIQTRSTTAAEALVIIVTLGFIFVGVVGFSGRSAEQLFQKERQTLRWLYPVLTLTVITSTWDMLEHFDHESHLWSGSAEMFRVSLHCDVIVLLLAVGTGVYLFKRTSKFWYGVSEIAVGIVANINHVENINWTKFPRIEVPWQDKVAIVLFVYLLSRGISNVIEATTERVEKTNQTSMDEPAVANVTSLDTNIRK